MVVLAGAGVLGYQTWHTNVEAKEIYSRPVVRDQGVPNSGAEGTDERPVTESQKKEYVVAPDMPRTMRIPSIGVDARVLRMGINDEGAVESPYNIWDTGWYDGSAKPGEKGNAFINGHISGPTEPAVFSKLKDVKVGAEVVVERGDGSLLTYRVISNQTKRLDDIRMNDVLALPIGSDEVLSIMTCGGDYL
jgi:LPXTG-site transpeptidase (sortase) family protein